jgi:hypothetical protein
MTESRAMTDILGMTEYLFTSLRENMSECLLFRWILNVFVAIFFWGIASCLAMTERMAMTGTRRRLLRASQ